MRFDVLQIMKPALYLALAAAALIPTATQYAYGAEPNVAAINSLVEQLASTNKRPTGYPEVNQDPIYPKDYDGPAQKLVWKAYFELYQLGPAAFPQLLEHLDDKRYSLTADTGNADHNFNVGFLCRWILQNRISPFNPIVAGAGYTTGRPAFGNLVKGPRGDAPRRPDFLSDLLRDQPKAKKWMLERATFRLGSIQEEVLKWMISEESKNPKIYDVEERTALKSLLRELESSESYLESKRPFYVR